MWKRIVGSDDARVLHAGMGYAVIAAAGLVLIFLLRQIPKLFRGMGGGRPKGRWVNDRSLGGKAVSLCPVRVCTSLQSHTHTPCGLPSDCVLLPSCSMVAMCSPLSRWLSSC